MGPDLKIILQINKKIYLEKISRKEKKFYTNDKNTAPQILLIAKNLINNSKQEKFHKKINNKFSYKDIEKLEF